MQTIEKIRKKLLSLEKGKSPQRGKLNIALFYPNSYEIAVTSLAFHRIFELINRVEETGIVRCFLEGIENKYILPLDGDFNLSDIDIIAFFLSYEMDFFNIVKALKLLKIPFFKKERGDKYPIIIGGGVAITENPEPVADFFDAIFIGEAEESLPAFLKLFFQYSERSQIMEKAFEIKGVYLPDKVNFSYGSDGLIKSIDGKKVTRGVYKDFEQDFSKSIFMTELSKFGNTFLIELTRGCPARCRFCVSRTVYNPVRFANYEAVRSIITELKEVRKIGLLGASVSFHPHIKSIMDYILTLGKEFSISSLRAEKMDDEFLMLLKKGGTKTITFAPESGSEKTRTVINKGISREDIEKAIFLSLKCGVENLKLYFMIGLPFEEQEDIEAIVKMGNFVRELEKCSNKRFKKVVFNITPFVPKPFTPFQWAKFEPLNSIKSKLNYLRKSLTAKGINVLYDNPKWTYIEALLSRGDRKLEELLIKKETEKHYGKTQINEAFYISRQRRADEVFPWDFIDIGVSKEALLRDWQKVIS